MDETYTANLSTNDPLYKAKYATIQSLNQMSSKIRENKEKIYSKIYFSFSLIFAIFIAIFADSLSWWLILLFVNLSMILLVFYAKDYYKERRELKKERKKIIKALNDFGIPAKE